MGVAIDGIEHETNTYATASMGPTTLERFATLHGEEFDRVVGTRTTRAGFTDGAAGLGLELVPTFWAMAGPSGIVERTAYDSLRSDLLEGLRAAGPVDAVALSLQGAGVDDGVDDLEGDVVRAVHEVVGDIPIVATLDLHGNMTAEMADVIDVMLGVHEYPHVDFYERGVEVWSSSPGCSTVRCNRRGSSSRCR